MRLSNSARDYGGEAMPLFGLGEIASPWIRDRAFAHNVKEVHEVLAHA